VNPSNRAGTKQGVDEGRPLDRSPLAPGVSCASDALRKAGVNNSPVAVSLPDPVSDGPYSTPGQNGGFLGAAYAPFAIYGDPNDDEFAVSP